MHTAFRTCVLLVDEVLGSAVLPLTSAGCQTVLSDSFFLKGMMIKRISKFTCSLLYFDTHTGEDTDRTGRHSFYVISSVDKGDVFMP